MDGELVSLASSAAATVVTLLATDASAAAELARMARGLDCLRRDREVPVRQDATASGRGIVIQAGRDARIGQLPAGQGG